eukprot:TRINITY_DN65940_c11_g2_i1.p1 TRINITY_DN65940_c11_g2~~TRINITY_DN65940_c11_g2_i1.p1  ORF type:complete len:682 (-),score=72.67 TRINITY_DN65940_c11_g2_i1:158-2008(-)
MMSMVQGGWNEESKKKAIALVNEQLGISDDDPYNTHVIAQDGNGDPAGGSPQGAPPPGALMGGPGSGPGPGPGPPQPGPQRVVLGGPPQPGGGGGPSSPLAGGSPLSPSAMRPPMPEPTPDFTQSPFSTGAQQLSLMGTTSRSQALEQLSQQASMLPPKRPGASSFGSLGADAAPDPISTTRMGPAGGSTAAANGIRGVGPGGSRQFHHQHPPLHQVGSYPAFPGSTRDRDEHSSFVGGPAAGTMTLCSMPKTTAAPPPPPAGSAHQAPLSPLSPLSPHSPSAQPPESQQPGIISLSPSRIRPLPGSGLGSGPLSGDRDHLSGLGAPTYTGGPSSSLFSQTTHTPSSGGMFGLGGVPPLSPERELNHHDYGSSAFGGSSLASPTRRATSPLSGGIRPPPDHSNEEGYPYRNTLRRETAPYGGATSPLRRPPPLGGSSYDYPMRAPTSPRPTPTSPPLPPRVSLSDVYNNGRPENSLLSGGLDLGRGTSSGGSGSGYSGSGQSSLFGGGGLVGGYSAGGGLLGGLGRPPPTGDSLLGGDGSGRRRPSVGSGLLSGYGGSGFGSGATEDAQRSASPLRWASPLGGYSGEGAGPFGSANRSASAAYSSPLRQPETRGYF